MAQECNKRFKPILVEVNLLLTSLVFPNHMKRLDISNPISRRQLLSWAAGLALSISVPNFAQATEKKRGDKIALPQRKPAAPRVLVIDPGHGGRDPGAIGLRGTEEKRITIDIAQRLVDVLGQELGIEVRLTRSTDIFLPLAERVKIARKANADLFISIHADSAPNPAARGLSAYTLSEKASDDFAKAIALQENMADALAGGHAPTDDADVIAILADLAARHTRNAAQRAKAKLIDGAGRNLTLLDNPMRSANFAVLRAPDVPSMLIETGFLSNPKDELILRDRDARAHIAEILGQQLANILNSAPFV